MHEQVENPKYSKSRTVANSVSQKRNYDKKNCSFVDNRSTDKQLGSLHEMTTIEDPLQGKFIGDLAIPLLEINPSLIGLDDSYFVKFYKELSDHEASIIVVGGPTSYDPSNKTLYLNEKQIDFLKRYTRAFASKESEEGDGAVAASYIAMISHELSHARDHIIKGKDIGGSIKDVIDSELRAWAVEAISSIEVSDKVKEIDEGKNILVESWINIESSMLDDLSAYADSNEIINRLQRYIIRGLKMKDQLLIQEWVEDNKDFLVGEIGKLSGAVAKRVS